MKLIYKLVGNYSLWFWSILFAFEKRFNKILPLYLLNFVAIFLLLLPFDVNIKMRYILYVFQVCETNIEKDDNESQKSADKCYYHVVQHKRTIARMISNLNRTRILC